MAPKGGYGPFPPSDLNLTRIETHAHQLTYGVGPTHRRSSPVHFTDDVSSVVTSIASANPSSPWQTPGELPINKDFTGTLHFPDGDPMVEILAAYPSDKENTRLYVIPDRLAQRSASISEILDQKIQLWLVLLKQMDDWVARYQLVSARFRRSGEETKVWRLDYDLEYRSKSRTASKWVTLWENTDANLVNMRIAKARQVVMQMAEDTLLMERTHNKSKYNRAEKRARTMIPAGLIDEDAADLIDLDKDIIVFV
jgi:hypothetical protein